MSNLLSAYFEAQIIHLQITGYEKAGRDQATSHGPFNVDINPENIFVTIADARQKLCRHLSASTSEESTSLARIEEIHTASGRLRGALFGQAWSEDEKSLIAARQAIFETNWQNENCFTAFTILSFYYQPFELALMPDVSRLDWNSLRRYLHFLLRQPHIMQEADEKKYITYYKQMTEWLFDLIEAKDKQPESPALLKMIEQTLTFGACYYVDCPTLDLIHARSKIVKALTQRNLGTGALRPFPPSPVPARGRKKLRFGVLSYNSSDFTDTRALYALFQSFDPERYEIYWYSLDIIDPTSISDINFARKFHGRIHKIVSMRGNGQVMAQQILSDDLDILAVGTAYSFSAHPIDQMLSFHLARVQVVLNAMIPGSQGFPSYDYLITCETDEETLATYKAQCCETIMTIPDPLIWYEKRPRTVPDPGITRVQLGIPENAIVYCSGASANKHMPGTLRTWLETLRRVPGSYLLFYPFNPAWGGYFIGLTFLARLQALLKQYPDVDPMRIVVVRQVTPEEGNRLILLSDIYFGSFPHGGATSAMLALRHGKPVVARKSRWLRSTSDPSLLNSMDLGELIGTTNEDTTAIAVKLGLDAGYRRRISDMIMERVENAPFFDIVENSHRLQVVFDEIAAKHNLLGASEMPLGKAG